MQLRGETIGLRCASRVSRGLRVLRCVVTCACIRVQILTMSSAVFSIMSMTSTFSVAATCCVRAYLPTLAQTFGVVGARPLVLLLCVQLVAARPLVLLLCVQLVAARRAKRRVAGLLHGTRARPTEFPRLPRAWQRVLGPAALDSWLLGVTVQRQQRPPWQPEYRRPWRHHNTLQRLRHRHDCLTVAQLSCAWRCAACLSHCRASKRLFLTRTQALC